MELIRSSIHSDHTFFVLDTDSDIWIKKWDWLYCEDIESSYKVYDIDHKMIIIMIPDIDSKRLFYKSTWKKTINFSSPELWLQDPSFQWKVRVEKVIDPDTWKYIPLTTKFINPMNYYNTAVIRKEQNTSVKSQKPIEVLPFQVRFWKSEDNIKAQLLRLIPEEEDIDELTILIEPIF